MNQKERDATIDALRRTADRLRGNHSAARQFLYAELGTHNKDGSICEEYGGAYTDIDHPVHASRREAMDTPDPIQI